MTDVMYRLSSDTNTIIFTLVEFSVALNRSQNEMTFPYVKNPYYTDQVSTIAELSIVGEIKPFSTGAPYSSTNSAINALLLLMPNEYNSKGWILQGGDWNGTTWTYNSSYPHSWGDSNNKLVPTVLRYSTVPSDPILGAVKFNLNMKYGTLF